MSAFAEDVCIGVLGAGAWGTALANVCARSGRRVILWTRDAHHCEALAHAHENSRYLPGIALEKTIEFTSDMQALAHAQIILVTVPTQVVRQVLKTMAPMVSRTICLVICAKGIERDSKQFLSDVCRAEMPQAEIAVLSGPSFAHDVSRGLPTAVTLAAHHLDYAAELARIMSGRSFRLYHSDDVRGVEIGGATKNVLAIATGIAHGRGLGASAGAALIARGFAELSRFGHAYGARAETLMGLSGLGDLVLTCSSEQSRNFSFGVALGRGEFVAEAHHGKLAEGSFTASVLVELAQHHKIDMPIAQSVDAVIAGRLSVDQSIELLMSRPSRAETIAR
jgi:glycerol-3-phosphate dehydrogenase (NAD(P)+)